MKNQRNLLKHPSLSAFVILTFCIHFTLYGQVKPTIEGVGINEQVFTFNIGKFKCVSINDGDHYYQLNDFFANVPITQIKDTLRKRNLPLESMYSPYTHLIVNTGDNIIYDP